MAKERVQVQGLGDAVPGIQPTIQRGGQYAVQVQRAGRNKLMDLADALGQVNPLLQQYGALQKQQEQIGIEEAEVIEEKNLLDEVRKLKDVDKFSFLGTATRKRAKRDALLKRHFNSTMLPNLQAKASELVNVDKYRTEEEFLEAVNGEINASWENLVKDVGSDVANSTAAKALWSTVTTPYKNKLRLDYIDAEERFIDQEHTVQLGLELNGKTKQIIQGDRVLPLDVSGFQDIVENREKLLKDDGVSPKRRSQILVNAFTTEVKSLIAQGRFRDAELMVASMQMIRVPQKGKEKGLAIFNTTEAKMALNTVVADIRRNTEVKSDVTAARLASRFAADHVKNASDLRINPTKESVSDTTLQRMRNELEQLGITDEEEINDLIDRTFSGDAPAMNNWEGIISEVSLRSDAANDLYRDSFAKINTNFRDLATRPRPSYAVTNKDEEVAEFESWMSDNPSSTAEDFIKQNSKDYTVFPQLRAKEQYLNRGEYVKDLATYKAAPGFLEESLEDVIIRDPALKRKEKQLGNDIGIFASEVGEIIKDKLLEKGAELYDKYEGKEGAVQLRSTELKQYRDELVKEYKDTYKARAQALLNIGGVGVGVVPELSPEEKEKIQKAKAVLDKDGIFTGDYVYESLQQSAPSVETLYKDRELMFDRGHKPQLQKSLINFGFARFTDEAARLLREADLDADEVSLFGDRRDLGGTYKLWQSVIQKDQSNISLTESEKKLRDQYVVYGILTEEDLNLFIDTQAELLPER